MDNYSDKIRKLYDLQHAGIKLGLGHITELLSHLGNPEESLKFVHVAGTNGKGSVCAVLASALKGVGYRVGFYSSPHLVSLRERFRINGEAISREKLSKLIDCVWPVVEKMYSEDKNVTFFEVTVSMAALYFAREKCDFVLWETGLGGRLDSTNVVSPVITAITGIGLDHEKYLGDTEEKIAFEKAGIIKKKTPIFVGKMSSSVLQVIKEVASGNSAPFFSVEKENLSFFKVHKDGFLGGWWFSEDTPIAEVEKNTDNCYYLPLPGAAQPNNMELAYIILKNLSKMFDFCLETALHNIKTLKWYGRIQQLPDGKILDGSHNPQGTLSLVETLQDSFKNRKFIIILGCLEERNPKHAISILSAIAEEFIFVPISSSRKCFPPKESLSIAKDIVPGISCSAVDSLKGALGIVNKKNSKKILITGSLYLAGEALAEYFTKEEIVNI